MFLSSYDEKEIKWYLRDGLPEFEGGSTMGPILDNTSLFARNLCRRGEPS